MTTKTFTKKDKKGREETWEWEETPEVLAALEQLSKSTQGVKDLTPGTINKSNVRIINHGILSSYSR